MGENGQEYSGMQYSGHCSAYQEVHFLGFVTIGDATFGSLNKVVTWPGLSFVKVHFPL